MSLPPSLSKLYGNGKDGGRRQRCRTVMVLPEPPSYVWWVGGWTDGVWHRGFVICRWNMAGGWLRRGVGFTFACVYCTYHGTGGSVLGGGRHVWVYVCVCVEGGGSIPLKWAQSRLGRGMGGGRLARIIGTQALSTIHGCGKTGKGGFNQHSLDCGMAGSSPGAAGSTPARVQGRTVGAEGQINQDSRGLLSIMAAQLTTGTSAGAVRVRGGF